MSDTTVADPPVTTATTTTTQEPWYSDWVQKDGTLNAKSLDRLPDHLKPLKETWSRQKTIDDIGTTTVHFQNLASKKALAPLTPDAPKEVVAERKAHLDAMNGVPKTPKEYGITRPADIPESAWNQELADNFINWAHENSVSPGALKKFLNEVQLPSVKKQLAARDQTVAQYYTAQAAAFDAAIKRENIPSEKANALIEKGVISLGLDPESEETKNDLKRANFRLAVMRHAISTGEDTFVQGDSRATENNPGDLAEDAVRNPANPINGPYWNREQKFSRAAHDAAVAKVTEWRRLASAKQTIIDNRRK